MNIQNLRNIQKYFKEVKRTFTHEIYFSLKISKVQLLLPNYFLIFSHFNEPFEQLLLFNLPRFSKALLPFDLRLFAFFQIANLDDVGNGNSEHYFSLSRSLLIVPFFQLLDSYIYKKYGIL